MAEDFGTDLVIVHADGALGSPKPRPQGLVGAAARLIRIIGGELLSGRYRRSPLFDESGAPRVVPRILTAEELADLKADQAAPE